MELSELKALATAATPGPWGRLHDTPPTVQADDFGPAREDGSRPALAIPTDRTCNCAQVWSGPADCPVAYCAVGPDCGPEPSGQMANAAFIAAAHPQRVLALIAVAEAAKAVADFAHKGRIVPRFDISELYVEGGLAESVIEDSLHDALIANHPELPEWTTDGNHVFKLGGDHYDHSLEVHFEIDVPPDWEPALAVRQAMYDHGFATVFWNFKDGTEIRGTEPRHSRDSKSWIGVDGIGYITPGFDVEAWKASPRNCRGKIVQASDKPNAGAGAAALKALDAVLASLVVDRALDAGEAGK